MSDLKNVKRVLVSVYDKTGLLSIAKTLNSLGAELLSTGGTAKHLEQNDIPVTRVSDVTGFPEILRGRVKTLHPRIHGGILAKRTDSEQMRELKSHDIVPVDMVIVNLYPFETVVSDPDVSMQTALENIDIGGPTMVRAAAKNNPDVAVVTDPDQYEAVIQELETNQGTTLQLRRKLALAAFQRTAQYDQAISAFLAKQQGAVQRFGENITIQLSKVQNLRYGENPHQAAAFYADASIEPAGVVAAKQLHGKELSYNNIMDLNAAINMALEFEQPAVSIIKHSNPCGAAVHKDLATAYDNALKTDNVSAFGGIVAVNRSVEADLAERISQIFTEVVVAPNFSRDALNILTQKKNIRLLKWPVDKPVNVGYDIKAVDGGLLLQDHDRLVEDSAEYKVVTRREPTQDEWAAMQFGWTLCKWVKSNAVIYVNAHQTLGIGAGQMSRVDASRLAVRKAGDAGLDLTGSVVVSDAFFPFRDGVDAAAKAGARAVIEPGGSIRDNEVIEAANEHDMTMVFTGHRHFRH
ncbi:MAG: bifunctional phosphoribosylaminoimidazolecarboxamide formyltransferase/IMP cyclohydrolase [candidate division KSB1 bacterium]|nr:bifunctional phosphoribosylaminoimidazolecarboxamide formyltransferase/IMP cyclohydrolase [candidate division KSB1 bacterium]